MRTFVYFTPGASVAGIHHASRMSSVSSCAPIASPARIPSPVLS